MPSLPSFSVKFHPFHRPFSNDMDHNHLHHRHHHCHHLNRTMTIPWTRSEHYLNSCPQHPHDPHRRHHLRVLLEQLVLGFMVHFMMLLFVRFKRQWFHLLLHLRRQDPYQLVRHRLYQGLMMMILNPLERKLITEFLILAS